MLLELPDLITMAPGIPTTDPIGAAMIDQAWLETQGFRNDEGMGWTKLLAPIDEDAPIVTMHLDEPEEGDWWSVSLSQEVGEMQSHIALTSKRLYAQEDVTRLIDALTG